MIAPITPKHLVAIKILNDLLIVFFKINMAINTNVLATKYEIKQSDMILCMLGVAQLKFISLTY